MRIGLDRRPLTYTAQRIVALLGTHDTPLPRRFVAFTLWLDKDEERALANLRSLLWRLGDELAGLVEADVHQIGLDDRIRVDFLQARRDALDVVEGRSLGLVHTYLSDLLPGWYEDWVITERERLRQLHLHALERQAERCLDRKNYGESVNCSMAATAIDPLRERAHRLMIQALMAQGNAADAVRVYDSYRDRLHTELGLEPSSSIADLLWSEHSVAL
jgi:DNA-binding SARP family transcriptional activator